MILIKLITYPKIMENVTNKQTTYQIIIIYKHLSLLSTKLVFINLFFRWLMFMKLLILLLHPKKYKKHIRKKKKELSPKHIYFCFCSFEEIIYYG